MDEVYSNIDQYRMEALKNISMEKYDEVKVGCDPEVTGKNQKREKLFRIQSKLLRFYEYLTSTNIILSIMVLAFISVVVLPEVCYAFSAIDRHFFGYLHEREPIYAKTTAN